MVFGEPHTIKPIANASRVPTPSALLDFAKPTYGRDSQTNRGLQTIRRIVLREVSEGASGHWEMQV
jgi:hypothetical protein